MHNFLQNLPWERICSDFCDKMLYFMCLRKQCGILWFLWQKCRISSGIMVLIYHKYNSKWGRKAKMNWFKLTCAKLTSCNYLQVHYRLKLAYINHWKISFKYHNIFWLSQYRDISKWCNILHSRYVAIQNAHP